jgi:DnaJ-class molecular chaperone
MIETDESTTCLNCAGKGSVRVYPWDTTTFYVAPCSTCLGSGRISKDVRERVRRSRENAQY